MNQETKYMISRKGFWNLSQQETEQIGRMRERDKRITKHLGKNLTTRTLWPSPETPLEQ
jgi:hypothetical protein